MCGMETVPGVEIGEMPSHYEFASQSLEVNSRPITIERRDLRKSRSSSPPPVNKRAALKIKQSLALKRPLEFSSMIEMNDFLETVDSDVLNLKYDFEHHYSSYIARQNFNGVECSPRPNKDRSSENLPTAQGLLNMSALDENLRVEYINASLIDDPPALYVATQHPLENSILDFWKMILVVRPSVILMLDGLEYLSRDKYPKYWPENAEVLTMQNTADTLLSVRVLSNSQGTSFGVTNSLQVILHRPNNEILQEWSVWHIRCDCWQDQSQIELMKFTELWREVQRKKADNPKMVVHCIGGIGRTGTFITVDMAVRQMGRQSQVSVDNIILKLRRHRMNIVAHPLHYTFCYRAALKIATDL